MRFISFLLCLLLCGSSASYAGFIVKHKRAVTAVSSPSDDVATDSTQKVKRMKSRAETFQDGPPYAIHTHRERKQHSRDANRGTGGGGAIAALVFACLGYWPISLILSIPAMRRGRRNSTIARVAFIISLVQAAVTVLMIALVLAIYA